jgi:pimeloyl-ACP methyl ester carboxylesterase
MVWRIWGGGEPVVLAHGAQGSWSHWIRNIDALAAERMVIAADLPGHGDSAMPASDDHPAISAALAEGLRRILGERLPVELVGFSLGGVVFSYLAALQPGIARRVVLVGCGGLDTPLGRVNLGRVSGLKGEERRAALKSNLLGLMLHDPDSVDDFAIWQLEHNARRARLSVAAELVIPDMLVKVLPDAPVPVDAIWGEFDRPNPDPHLQEEVLRRFQPEADFRVIADAGHWVMYERAEAFDAALLDTLRQPLRSVR